MRYGIFSDVHSNLEALEAVLGALTQDRIDRLLCAGDLVGYGADPTPCLKSLREKTVQAVCGNHDQAVAGGMDLDWFNKPAQAAVLWTRANLPEAEQSVLKRLPYIWQDGQVTLAHGSLHEPERFHYVLDLETARASLHVQKTPVAFIGHTHVPGFFLQKGEEISFSRERQWRVDPVGKLLVNVGSVGQPRDGDPRACYCLYDTAAETVELRRVAYPVERTQEKIRKAGLPEFLAERLEYGY